MFRVSTRVGSHYVITNERTIQYHRASDQNYHITDYKPYICDNYYAHPQTNLPVGMLGDLSLIPTECRFEPTEKDLLLAAAAQALGYPAYFSFYNGSYGSYWRGGQINLDIFGWEFSCTFKPNEKDRSSPTDTTILKLFPHTHHQGTEIFIGDIEKYDAVRAQINNAIMEKHPRLHLDPGVRRKYRKYLHYITPKE